MVTPSSPEKLILNVLDQMLEGFQIIDKDWKYVYVNETVAKQGKKLKEDLIGKTMMESYPGIELTPLFKQLKKSMDEKVSISFENEFKYVDLTSGWFQLYIHPWDEGIIIFSVDITERKRAEQELYEKIEELDKMSDLVIGREVKMVELKQSIMKLQDFIPDFSQRVIGK